MASNSASATTAARLAAFGLAWTAACAPAEPAAGPVLAVGAAPELRVALLRGLPQVDLGGGAGLHASDPEGRPLAELPAEVVIRAAVTAGGVTLRVGGTAMGPLPVLVITPADSGGTVRVDGREYRGQVRLEATTTGLQILNLVDIEDYLAGVVNAEMGRRGPGEEAAMESQAIVSRTFALRMLGRWRTQGYDLLATVADQAYGGVATETPAGRASVAATRGIVLTYEGRPIEAFFHSTCGGRTAAGAEAFSGGDLPFLPSVPDLSPDGRAWCEISPRYRWQEQWAADRLQAILRETLPATGFRDPGAVEDLRVTGRSESGRATGLAISGGGQDVLVPGPRIRQVLRPEGGTLLRSTAFELQVTRAGGRIVRVGASGRGNGHGVGMCQWGAVGRSRAGYSAEQILAAYFPGTTLERRW